MPRWRTAPDPSLSQDVAKYLLDQVHKEFEGHTTSHRAVLSIAGLVGIMEQKLGTDSRGARETAEFFSDILGPVEEIETHIFLCFNPDRPEGSKRFWHSDKFFRGRDGRPSDGRFILSWSGNPENSDYQIGFRSPGGTTVSPPAAGLLSGSGCDGALARCSLGRC